MTDAISSINGNNSSIDSTTINSTKNELDQDAFLKLMLAQLRHQDPLEPVDNTEFVAQTAQFSTVTGINAMRESLSEFVDNQQASQALSSAGLLGKTAMISGNKADLTADNPLQAQYELPHSSGTTTASFVDQNGTVVHQMALGAMPAGTHTLEWDGSRKNNAAAPNAQYTVRVDYLNDEGEVTAAPIAIAETIQSLVLGKNGTQSKFTLSDGRSVNITDVKEIKN